MSRKTVRIAVFALLALSTVTETQQQPDSFTSFGAYWHNRTSQFRTLPNPEREICFLGDSPQTIVYLQSVLPTNEELGTQYSNTKINPLNDLLVTLAAEKKVAWVDLRPVFRDDRGKLKKELTMDGLHLNGQAYYLWYSVIRKYILSTREGQS